MCLKMEKMTSMSLFSSTFDPVIPLIRSLRAVRELLSALFVRGQNGHCPSGVPCRDAVAAGISAAWGVATTSRSRIE